MVKFRSHLDGIKTGLELTGGIVSSRQVHAIPTPAAAIAGLGISVNIQPRDWAANQGTAHIEAHLEASLDEARLEWTLPLGADPIAPAGGRISAAQGLVRDVDVQRGKLKTSSGLGHQC